ncbi:Putative ammonium transporter 3 [Durusdinium trenchii]|uniref:Ammonium transporter 3 n=1 Tax=Durusdinium trenchii TaxID=1381693 RepID=A0ABP0PZY7_9DINO
MATGAFATCDVLAACPVVQEIIHDVNGDYADDATWVLTSSFVILTMQSGFGMLEMGCSHRGHEVNIMLKNVFDVIFGGLAYYMLGFGISHGSPSNSFMGLGDFLVDSNQNDQTLSGLRFSSYIFQFSFAATSTTIVSGCLAMRCRFMVYCFYSFYSVVMYAFVAHWVWAENGWLKEFGAHDFAGSGPVHMFGAINGFIGIVCLGPRLGRFDGSRPGQEFHASSPASILFGLFMLWWGCLVKKMMHDDVILEKRNPEEIANGILGALVSITATCVHPFEALVIGFVGSIIALLTNDLVEFRLRIDDPVGAIGVHGSAAMWGILAVGLFADTALPGIQVDNGLLRGGGLRLMGAQLVLMLAILGWSLVVVTPFFLLVGIAFSGDWRDFRRGLRVDPEHEISGLDQAYHGFLASIAGVQTAALF